MNEKEAKSNTMQHQSHLCNWHDRSRSQLRVVEVLGVLAPARLHQRDEQRDAQLAHEHSV